MAPTGMGGMGGRRDSGGLNVGCKDGGLWQGKGWSSRGPAKRDLE